MRIQLSCTSNYSEVPQYADDLSDECMYPTCNRRIVAAVAAVAAVAPRCTDPARSPLVASEAAAVKFGVGDNEYPGLTTLYFYPVPLPLRRRTRWLSAGMMTHDERPRRRSRAVGTRAS